MSGNNSGPNKPAKSVLASLINENPRLRTSALVPPVLQQVGKLAAGVASVSTGPSNSGSATGNPRNKCALQPGYSLMDWIRLGSSGKDLSGVGPRAGHLSVTRHELSLHNKENDAWLAIRGKVYNITEYLPFHPGGPEELMKGAGIDATKLFEQIHPWVNYDQILQKCLIGRLVSFDPGTDTAALFFGEKNTSPKNTTDVNLKSLKLTIKAPEIVGKEGDLKKPEPREPRVKFLEKYPPKVDSATAESDEQQEDTPVLPRFDWIQRIEWVTIIFYTKAFSNPFIEVLPPDAEKTIVICLVYDETIYRNEINFYDKVDWPCSIKLTCETGKVEFMFRKAVGKVWDNYGTLRQQSDVDSDAGNCCLKCNFVFRGKKQVNHNIFLIKLDRTDGGKMVIPIGKHIRAFGNVDGQEMARSYTPVPQSLFTKLAVHGPTTDNLCLMIKRYDQGNVSRFLTDREQNDVIHVTRPLGNFQLKEIERMETFILLAAGTGITPMLSLLIFLLERRIKKCQFVRLLFFNRTEHDIPLKEQLEELVKNDSRLKVNHILSEPDDHWTGLTGHVDKKVIENSIQEHIKDTGYTIEDMYTFICGPNPFVSLAIDELQAIGITSQQIYAFQG